MIVFLGMIGLKHVFIYGSIHIIIVLFSLIILFKKEKGANLFLWLAAIFCIPYLGSLFYLLKYFISTRKER